jgi:hypothetical protein
MKKKLLLCGLLALAVPVLWLGSTTTGGGSENGFGFGKQVAGAWIATLDMGGASVDTLGTLTADGNVIISGALRWAGLWENTRYNTTSHGTWTRVGNNGIRTLTLLQVQDNDGNLVFYEKVTLEVKFNKAGTRLEGSGMWQLYEAGIDPLDPQSPVAYEGGFGVSMRPIQ